jgi:hypothetical protein
LSIKWGSLSAVMAIPSNNIYQVSFWSKDPPVTAQISDYSESPGQSIKSKILTGIF